MEEHTGHTSNGACNIIEVCGGSGATDSIMSPLLNKLKGVTQIVNGGSYFEHPDGPIGLEGPYNYEDGSDSDYGEDSVDDDETETLTGTIGAMMRGWWVKFCTIFENSANNRNDETVLYSIKDLTKEKSGIGSRDEWLETLENMTNDMLEDGKWIYSNEHNKTDYQEAKKELPHRRSNCALMVVHALQLFRSV